MQIWLFENTDLRIEGKIIVRCRPDMCPIDARQLARAPWARLGLWPSAHARQVSLCSSRTDPFVRQGFDEYMNVVLDEAEELSIKKKTRKALGRILLKGDNITLMMNTGA